MKTVGSLKAKGSHALGHILVSGNSVHQLHYNIMWGDDDILSLILLFLGFLNFYTIGLHNSR